MTERYAIYYTLKLKSSLYQKAAIWLGYDAYTQQTFSKNAQQLPETLRDNEHLKDNASSYGFHATLKPPFRLNPDSSVDQLKRHLQRFAKKQSPFTCDTLQLQQIGGFLALIPTKPCENLINLANNCVMEFDEHRAPLNKLEFAKRNPEKLSHKQQQLLNLWGYPYVMEEFRFHMTLSNQLPKNELNYYQAALQDYFGTDLDQPLNIDAIYLFYQKDAQSAFVIDEIYNFAS